MSDPGAGGSTYRLQLQPGFDFDDARAVLDYIRGLGITHAYFSPYLQAAPGSTHGYDVVDPTRVSDDLGGPAGLQRLLDTLRAEGLGQVLDIVPNHMRVGGPENAWWWDVLENGPSSRYALYFDIAWDPPEPRLRNRILVPVLGDRYGRILDRGEITLLRRGSRVEVRYFEHRFPVSPGSLGAILETVPMVDAELSAIAGALRHLPAPTPDEPDLAEQRHDRLAILRQRLARRLRQDARLAGALDEILGGLPRDPDRLDALLEQQHYQLARWQAASSDLDYRRFFDITSLAAIRVSDPRVFAETHRLVLAWLREGTLDGVRIDHPDGLRDPRGYVARLKAASRGAWIVVEKILATGERLPDDWPVDGTTGYDAAFRTTALFVDPDGEQPLTEAYQELTGETASYAEVAYQSKQLVMRELLGSDLRRLSVLLDRIAGNHRCSRDFTLRELDRALREVIAAFPVYRTYVVPNAVVSRQDQDVIGGALEAAVARMSGDADLVRFIGDILLGRLRGGREDEFVARFQQTTAPVMAKGIEDTAFYRFNRLLCLNEVGGDPTQFGITAAEYHRANAATQERWPATMLAGSTHDMKRSEDVRARLALLSEIPSAWRAAASRWMAHNDRHRRGPWPDRNIEYHLYQTMVGAYPVSSTRLRAYALKATREAKVHTSWLDPNLGYEQSVDTFLESVANDPVFQDDLKTFVRPLIAPGRSNALAMKLLTLTAPGVPDLYQGSELWTGTLVDPDNREPVDFTIRRRLLAEVGQLALDDILARSDEGLPKLHLVTRALALRAQRPDSFGPMAGYRSLIADGPDASSVVAFERGGDVVAVAPRLRLRRGAEWGDTVLALAPGTWRNVLTGEREGRGPVALGAMLQRFPVALLVRDA